MRIQNGANAANTKLSRRALNALLYGRYASIGGRTISQRAKRLVDIASAYDGHELSAETGVGPVTLREIRDWLRKHGRSLRCGPK